MSTGNYLRRELIENDLDRFAQGLADRLNATVSALFLETEEDSCCDLGYNIQTSFNNYKVTMAYDRNQWGEYALEVYKGNWDVLINDSIKATGNFPTLQEVMDFIGENDKDSFAK